MPNLDSWSMASAYGNANIGAYQRDIVGDTPLGVVDGTEKRDVSEMLDLLALADTPFINKVGWGPETGGTTIEWISEDLGNMTAHIISAVGTDVTSLLFSSGNGIQGSELINQIHHGTIMYMYSSLAAHHAITVVTSEPALAPASVTACILVSALAVDTYASYMASAAAGETFYILGNVVNEGSEPSQGKPRERVVSSNGFTILRQDVAITGSMKETDMYIIGREDRHQVLMRLKELQRERENMALYSARVTKTSTMAGLINGCFGFLTKQSGSHIDRTTKSLTETAVNTLVTAIWKNGGRNLTMFAAIEQTAKFTRWDKNRIRTRINDGKGGGQITSYLTESGIELDLVPMAYVPPNLAFVVDTSKIKLRAKKNRKAIMEKLGKRGDFDAWQILSEFSMEMKGHNLGQHGGFFNLA